MITEHMTLNATADARAWASQLGLETPAQEKAVADYIWANRPEIGCTYGEFIAANPEFQNEENFWDICEGK